MKYKRQHNFYFKASFWALSIAIFLTACSQPSSVSTLPTETANPVFDSSEFANAAPTVISSVSEIATTDLNNEEINIEGAAAPEELESELTSQAVLPGADGYLAYYRTNGSTYEIWVANQSDDSKVNVYSANNPVQSVAVDGTGNWVAASINNPAHGELDVYLFNIAGNQVYNLTNTNGKDEEDVSMTMMGTTIVYSKPTNAGVSKINMCSYNAVSNTCSVSILGATDDQRQASITSNGKGIALIRDLPDGRYRVLLYDVGNSSYQIVTTRPEELSHPSATDDGKNVMYLRNRMKSIGRYLVRIKNLSSNVIDNELSKPNSIGHPHVRYQLDYFTYRDDTSNGTRAFTRNIATNDRASAHAGNWDYYQPYWQKAYTAPPTNIIYVDKDATGANNGSSWINAFTKLRDALDCVNNGVSQDAHCDGRTFDDAGVNEIWVASGTYYPDEAIHRSGVTNNSDSEKFLLNQSTVKLYGGFDGVGAGGIGGTQETVRSQRNSDPMTNGTVLSGDIDQNDPTDGFSGTNAKRVVQLATNFETLSAETVIDGFKIEKGNTNSSGADGAGLYCDGIVVNKKCDVTFQNLYFYNNYALSGNGGGLYLENGIPGDFTDLIFHKNRAQYGGGIYMKDIDFGSNTLRPANPMDRLGFYDNSATVVGGGIYATNSKGTGGLRNSVFHKNGSFNGGGALYITFTFTDTGHRWNIYNNTFHDNDVTLGGGAININTAAIVTGSRAASIVNNMFTNNDDGLGGEDVFTNIGNAATDVFFNFNRVTGNGAGAPAASALEDNGVGTTLVGANNIFDGGSIYVDSNGADNIAGTPDDNFQLRNCFAAIDAGQSISVGSVDFAGNPRNVNGCNGIGIDIGAYEYQP